MCSRMRQGKVQRMFQSKVKRTRPRWHVRLLGRLATEAEAVGQGADFCRGASKCGRTCHQQVTFTASPVTVLVLRPQLRIQQPKEQADRYRYSPAPVDQHVGSRARHAPSRAILLHTQDPTAVLLRLRRCSYARLVRRQTLSDKKAEPHSHKIANRAIHSQRGANLLDCRRVACQSKVCGLLRSCYSHASPPAPTPTIHPAPAPGDMPSSVHGCRHNHHLAAT